ncbi:hypothetical protein ACOME3_008727 [Neoechinorhynchus agilis]
MDGILSIYKHPMTTAWRIAEGLGTISAMTYGSIGHFESRKCLFVVNSEGWLYLFRHKSPKKMAKGKATTEDIVNHAVKCIWRHRHHSADQLITEVSADTSEHSKAVAGEAAQSHCRATTLLDNQTVTLIVPDAKQLLVPNARMILLVDTNNNDYNELIISYADRHVRIFSYVQTEGPRVRGKFSVVALWTLDGQVGTITEHINETGTSEIIASQPGGTFISLNFTATANRQNTFTDTFYNPSISVSAQTGNNAFTEVIGSLSLDANSKTFNLVVATSDGFLALMNKNKISWCAQVDASIIGIDKLDIKEDKRDDVVLCGHDGKVFIFSADRCVYIMTLNYKISNFCAGTYGIDGKNLPCLAFLTHHNRIILYYDLQSAIPDTNMLDCMAELRRINDRNVYKYAEKNKKCSRVVTKKDVSEAIRKLAYDLN